MNNGGAAWDFYNKAVKLNPDDQVSKELLVSLDGLMRADAILDSLSNPQINENERKDKLQKIEAILKVAEEVKPLVNTSLLKNNRARYNLYQKKGLAQIVIIAIFAIIIVISLFALTLKTWGLNNPYFITMTVPQVPVTNTIMSVHPETATVSSIIIINTATTTYTPTATETQTPSPTATPLGYGRVTIYVFPVEIPNGRRINHSLKPGMIIPLFEESDAVGGPWYRCTWNDAGTTYEGWVLAQYIQIVPGP